VVDLEQFVACQGHKVQLEFTDGHTVIGRLLGVYGDDDQVVYDVIEVLRVGPSQYAGVKSGTSAMAKLSDVESFAKLESEAS